MAGQKKVSKAKTKKGGGGKLARSEVITVRLDPKLKMAAELGARKQRRTLSAFIEWCVSEMVVGVVVDVAESQTAFEAMTESWHSHESNRFWNIAKYYPYLMTFEESCLWDIIQEKQTIWDDDYPRKDTSSYSRRVDYEGYDPSSPFFRSAFTTLKKFIEGEIEEVFLDGILENAKANLLSIINEDKKGDDKKQ